MISRPLCAVVAALFLSVALAGCAGKGGKANHAPTVSLVVSEGAQPLVTVLDASGSTDPDGDALTYYWNWVIGSANTTTPRIEVEWPLEVTTNGSFAVSVVVRDPGGLSDGTYKTVPFGSSPQNQAPTIMLREGTRWVRPNVEAVLDAGLTVDPERDPMSYEWIWGPKSDYNPAQMGVMDACQQNDTTLSVFTTGCLGEGQSFSLTFDKAGTYDYHCHPHPWMKARLIVDPTVNGATPLAIDIADFAYPENVTRVGLGAVVTFRNRDPVLHTATVEDYTPGVQAGGSTSVFRQTLPAGDYVVRLIVKDIKGGRSTSTWGVKASADAPPNPDVRTSNDTKPLLQGQMDASAYYNVTFPYEITATLTWADGGTGQVVGNMTLGKVVNNEFKEKTACPAVRGAGFDPVNQATLTCRIDGSLTTPGVWNFRVFAVTGAVTDWNIVVTGIPYSVPGFGDSVAGGGHGGHGGH